MSRFHLPSWRPAWIALALAAAVPLAVASWFQHVDGLDPCVMCIYERVALFGLVGAGLLGALAPQRVLLRAPAYALWGVSAGWGLDLVWRHVAIERDPQLAISCSFTAEFPSWLPLDTWLPALFLPTGYCDDVQWRWLDLSMAEWAGVVFALFLLALVAVLACEIRRLRGGRAALDEFPPG
jgi:disulfide bond formation protein DsbB